MIEFVTEAEEALPSIMPLPLAPSLSATVQPYMVRVTSMPESMPPLVVPTLLVRVHSVRSTDDPLAKIAPAPPPLQLPDMSHWSNDTSESS